MSNITREQILEMQPGRELDALVAEYVEGLRVEVVRPDWYPVEVKLFIAPESGLIEYSYDAHACNAMMYRNRIDCRDGIAMPLPNYSDSDLDGIDTTLWMVERLCSKKHWVYSLHRIPNETWNGWAYVVEIGPGKSPPCETLSEAMCKAALLAVLDETQG